MTSARQCPALNGAARGRLAGPGDAGRVARHMAIYSYMQKSTRLEIGVPATKIGLVTLQAIL
jgi:hypothetical protein